MSSLSSFHQKVEDRFGLVPNFFMSAQDAPEIVEKLWDFATSAYFENPMPSLFKERLFVFLSRFCQIRYCIVRHCGFLVGYGHSAGDAGAISQTIEQAVKLLRSPPPWKRHLEPVYERLGRAKGPIAWPEPDSEMEDAIFATATLIFVYPSRSEQARQVLRHALGGRKFEFLLALLTFIRAAHFWTIVHPGLEVEDDMRELMAKHPDLASLLLEDPDVPAN